MRGDGTALAPLADARARARFTRSRQAGNAGTGIACVTHHRCQWCRTAVSRSRVTDFAHHSVGERNPSSATPQGSPLGPDTDWPHGTASDDRKPLRLWVRRSHAWASPLAMIALRRQPRLDVPSVGDVRCLRLRPGRASVGDTSAGRALRVGRRVELPVVRVRTETRAERGLTRS